MTAEERFERIERNLESVTQIQREQTAEIEKQNEGIKSLIVVAWTVLTSMQELRTVQGKAIEETRELHRTVMEEIRDLHKHTDYSPSPFDPGPRIRRSIFAVSWLIAAHSDVIATVASVTYCRITRFTVPPAWDTNCNVPEDVSPGCPLNRTNWVLYPPASAKCGK